MHPAAKQGRDMLTFPVLHSQQYDDAQVPTPKEFSTWRVYVFDGQDVRFRAERRGGEGISSLAHRSCTTQKEYAFFHRHIANQTLPRYL